MGDNLITEKLQIHYYFEDENKHSMDAYIFNKCEASIIDMIDIISKELGIKVTVEVNAIEEGGVKLWLEIIAISTSIIGGSLQIAGYVESHMSTAPTAQERLGNFESEEQEQIAKIKLEKKCSNTDKLSKNKKLEEICSNFYTSLENDEKKEVSKVSISKLNKNDEPENEKIIPRADFHKFIFEETEEDNIAFNEIKSVTVTSPDGDENGRAWKVEYTNTDDGKKFNASMKIKDSEFWVRVKRENKHLAVNDEMLVQWVYEKGKRGNKTNTAVRILSYNGEVFYEDELSLDEINNMLNKKNIVKDTEEPQSSFDFFNMG